MGPERSQDMGCSLGWMGMFVTTLFMIEKVLGKRATQLQVLECKNVYACYDRTRYWDLDAKRDNGNRL